MKTKKVDASTGQYSHMMYPIKVEVEMLKDQQSPDFGEKEKGEKFPMNADLAKIHSDRKILKIIEEVKNGKETILGNRRRVRAGNT